MLALLQRRESTGSETPTGALQPSSRLAASHGSSSPSITRGVIRAAEAL